MRRRDFIVGLGGAAAWPVAQQPERLRRMEKLNLRLDVLVLK